MIGLHNGKPIHINNFLEDGAILPVKFYRPSEFSPVKIPIICTEGDPEAFFMNQKTLDFAKKNCITPTKTTEGK